MFTWTDNVTKVWGPHTIKTGIFFDYNQAWQQPSWTDTTTFDFGTGSTNLNINMGQITGYRDPRIVQLGAKFYF